jgi:hypothetical protein
MAKSLAEYATAPELSAAWGYIQADFRIAFARRNRLRAGEVGFFELMRARSLSKLVREAEAEVDRLHSMLKAIDNLRLAASKEQVS